MPRPQHIKSWPQEVGVVTSVFLAQFLTQSGVTMSLTPMNIVLEAFNAKDNASASVWFMGGYSLTVGTFILISGRLGDLFGLKKMFLFGWGWVATWSLICGFSAYVKTDKAVIFFIICRAFQGIGFAFALPCGLGLLGYMYESGERKNVVFGIIGAGGPTGATLGAIMAAVIAQLGWWPWCYWAMSITAVVAGTLGYFSIPVLDLKKPEEISDDYLAEDAKFRNLRIILSEVDILGSVTGVCGLVLFNFCWNQGPVTDWTAYVIVLLVVSVMLIVLFFWLELKYVKNPLLHKSIFKVKIGLVLVCISLGWGSFGIWQYYFFNILLNFKHYTPISASITFLPLFCLGICASTLCSKIISKTRPSYIICFATICFLCGDIMLSVTPINQSYFRLLFGQMFLLAWGMDLSFPAASIILSDYLPPHHQGMAGSLVSTVVNYSVSLFLAVGSLVESEVKKRTADELYSIRQALHFAIGLSGCGVIFLLVFVFLQKRDNDSGTKVGDLELSSIVYSDKMEKDEETPATALEPVAVN